MLCSSSINASIFVDDLNLERSILFKILFLLLAKVSQTDDDDEDDDDDDCFPGSGTSKSLKSSISSSKLMFNGDEQVGQVDPVLFDFFFAFDLPSPSSSLSSF